ncbi:ATP-binding protein [Streptomyces sp. ISL-11]|uniref:ATP-binding protein n=1 Tax=Streptomyces sp. ISL-11 TaxID=2819174 RepID=UPI001BECE8E0|nr:ATP-binding protein [Streptomyces sp. ISL-11]MBT2383991.1 ATP-binding protein [Streptomyces sp. ISL-11]
MHTADAFTGAHDPVVDRFLPPRGAAGPWGPGIPLCMHSPPTRWRLHHLLPPGHPSRAVSLPATTRSVSAARRFCDLMLAEWGLQELADDAALLLSELVTNAIVHVPEAAGIELVLTRSQGHLIAQVTDAGGHLPRCGRAGPDSEGGRGMWLVEQIAARWGHHASGNGKTVWFTLRLP